MGSALRVKLILASASPRRQAFFRELGWDFEIKRPNVDESRAEGEAPEEMVLRLAGAKALDVWNGSGGRWVVGADTTVVADGEVLGKPRNAAEAEKMIGLLQGRTHLVTTGVSVIAADGRRMSALEKTEVTFRPLTSGEVSAYVEQGESMDKAGAYAIQGRGTLLVRKINGCYFNVVGLPLERLSELLAGLGWPLACQWRRR